MPTAEVHVLVLSHNRPAFLRQTLESLRAQRDIDLRVTVLDNASERSGEIAALVAASFPDVQLVRNRENLGFGRAMNQGFESVNEEYVFFLCDDIEVAPDALCKLRDHMRANPSVAMCTGALMEDDRVRVCAAGFTVRFGPPMLVDLRMRFELASALPSAPFAIDAVPGGIAFARTEVLKRWGAFHPSFYMYIEDVELSTRLRAAGFQLDCVPQARLVDLAAPHFKGIDLQPEKIKNTISMYFLHAPVGQLLGGVHYYGLRAVASAIRRRRPVRPYGAAWRGVVRELPTLLRDRWAAGAHAKGLTRT